MPKQFLLKGEHCIRLKHADDPSNLNWENVLISSHQYQDDIIKFLKNKNILNFINAYKNFHTNILDSY